MQPDNIIPVFETNDTRKRQNEHSVRREHVWITIDLHYRFLNISTVLIIVLK